MHQKGNIQRVNVAARGILAKADADRSGGNALVNAHCGEHVACLALVAGGACADIDAAGIQLGNDVLAGITGEGDGEDVGASPRPTTSRSGMAVRRSSA